MKFYLTQQQTTFTNHDDTITDCDITKNRDVTELGATGLKYHVSLGSQ